MPFLTVGGVTVWVVADGASESEPVRVGELAPAISGREGGAVRAEYSTYQFRAAPLSVADYATLAIAAPPDALVTCGGDALGGVSGLYRVTLASEFVRDGTTHRHLVTLTLEEA